MPEEQQEEFETVAVRQLVHSGGAPRYYANNTEVGMTSFDLSLRFAVIDHVDDEGLHVTDQAIITMSLHHAKVVAGILSAYINQYEKQNGDLFVPKVVMPQIEGDAVAVKIARDSPANPQTTQKQFEERPTDKPIPKMSGFTPKEKA